MTNGLTGTAPVPRRSSAIGWMAGLLGFAAILYTGLAAGCAIFLLKRASELPPNVPVGEFDKLAIAALVAVVGTGLTGVASVYSATVQAATASRVAEYNGDISTNLAAMKAVTDATMIALKADQDSSLAEVKARSDETLTRLKVALDLGHVAHRELFSAATIYFHALRSIGLGGAWDSDALKAAENGMIAATPRIIHVEQRMRDRWFNFWQRAQTIRISASSQPAPTRGNTILELMEKPVDKQRLRDVHKDLEDIASAAMTAASLTT